MAFSQEYCPFDSDLEKSRSKLVGNMLRRLNSNRNQQKSVKQYIGSVARYYTASVIVMAVLLGVTYIMGTVAIGRQAVQQQINFLTSSLFIGFQELGSQAQVVAMASTDPTMPDSVIAPMRESLRQRINESKQALDELDRLRGSVKNNPLEEFSHTTSRQAVTTAEITDHLREYLMRAEEFLDASNREERQHNPSGKEVDFPQPADNSIVRQFGDLIRVAHERSQDGIRLANLMRTGMFAVMATILVLTSLFLFYPLIRKLRDEHHRTSVYEGLLSKMAYTDSLTDLSNRAEFNMVLGNLFQNLKQGGSGFSMLLLDLDRFKGINDTLGHPAGDAVLCHVASSIKKVFRPTDVLARLGGDEFAILLPGVTDSSTLYDLAARSCRKIGETVVVEGRHLHVSTSIGGAVVPQHAQSEAELMRAADIALYAAKRSRNIAVIFGDTEVAAQAEQINDQVQFSPMLEGQSLTAVDRKVG